MNIDFYFINLNNNYTSNNISENLYYLLKKEDKYIGYDSNNFLNIYKFHALVPNVDTILDNLK